MRVGVRVSECPPPQVSGCIVLFREYPPMQERRAPSTIGLSRRVERAPVALGCSAPLGPHSFKRQTNKLPLGIRAALQASLVLVILLGFMTVTLAARPFYNHLITCLYITGEAGPSPPCALASSPCATATHALRGVCPLLWPRRAVHRTTALQRHSALCRSPRSLRSYRRCSTALMGRCAFPCYAGAAAAGAALGLAWLARSRLTCASLPLTG